LKPAPLCLLGPHHGEFEIGMDDLCRCKFRGSLQSIIRIENYIDGNNFIRSSWTNR
jgi:hypothetical protein